MLGYTTLGTSDLARAQAFYDAVFVELGAKLLLRNEREAYWGHTPEGTKFAVVVPFDRDPATVGNGTMIALRADNRQQVQRAHRAALEHGAIDEGGVGSRGEGSLYAGYFRDLDGHKICVFIT